ncbi:hypothetical protein M5K25_008293 [Dendrobium thyrsiflorum]|uniref:Uncharacterized protein n=1 Tax=Dendrobium thyrsiflorum TaxID=117978 RepID=A0ABD0VF37_DENTH
MMELFILGCAGVVVLLHSANFFFHALSRKIGFRSLRWSFSLALFSLSSLDSLGECEINGLGASKMPE